MLYFMILFLNFKVNVIKVKYPCVMECNVKVKFDDFTEF